MTQTQFWKSKSLTSLSDESPPFELGAGGGCWWWAGEVDVGEASDNGALLVNDGGCCVVCPCVGTLINGPAGW